MVNKRGFLRIVEAIIAVLIVLGAVLFVVVKNNASTSDSGLCEETNSLLNELAKNNTLRESVLDNELIPVSKFIDSKINNPLIDYRVKICNPDESCSLNEGGLDKIEICAGERLISTTPERANFNPKKVKIFLLKLS